MDTPLPADYFAPGGSSVVQLFSVIVWRLPLCTADGLEKMMGFITSMLLSIVVGSVILMAGMLILRDRKRSFRSVLRETLAWGAGFFIALSAQVVAIAAMH